MGQAAFPREALLECPLFVQCSCKSCAPLLASHVTLDKELSLSKEVLSLKQAVSWMGRLLSAWQQGILQFSCLTLVSCTVTGDSVQSASEDTLHPYGQLALEQGLSGGLPDLVRDSKWVQKDLVPEGRLKLGLAREVGKRCAPNEGMCGARGVRSN